MVCATLPKRDYYITNSRAPQDGGALEQTFNRLLLSSTVRCLTFPSLFLLLSPSPAGRQWGLSLNYVVFVLLVQILPCCESWKPVWQPIIHSRSLESPLLEKVGP